METLKLFGIFISFFSILILIIGVQRINDDDVNIKQSGYAPFGIGILFLISGIAILSKYYL